MKSSILSLLVLGVVCSFSAGASADDWLDVEVTNYDTGLYRVGVWLGVDGVTGSNSALVKIPALTNPFYLNEYSQGGSSIYGLETQGWNISQIKTFYEGDWVIAVNTSGGLCVYTFTVGTMDAGMFLTRPTITNPTGATAPEDVNFQWTSGGGSPDELWTIVRATAGGEWAEDSTDDGTLNLSDTSWQPGLAPNTGEARFAVNYDLIYPLDVTGSLVTTAIAFDAGLSGGTDFGWEEASLILTSADEATFVVPEPGTLLLLGAGVIALIRRRK